MKVVVAGRVSSGVDELDVLVCWRVVDCPLDVPLVDVVDCAAALEATANVNAAANTPGFNIPTSASTADSAGSPDPAPAAYSPTDSAETTDAPAGGSTSRPRPPRLI